MWAPSPRLTLRVCVCLCVCVCVCTWVVVVCYSSIPITQRGKSHGSVSSPRGPSAGLPAEGLTAAPRSREPEAVPYLEGLAASPCSSFNENLDSGASSSPDGDTPDDTSNSSSVVRWAREATEGVGLCSRPALGSHPNIQTWLSRGLLETKPAP